MSIEDPSVGQRNSPFGVRAYSYAMEGSTRETDFVALGQPGSEAYAGIETFPNPGVSHV